MREARGREVRHRDGRCSGGAAGPRALKGGGPVGALRGGWARRLTSHARLPSSSLRPSTSHWTPWPARAWKARGSAVGSESSCARRQMARPMGCSESRSAHAARRRSEGPSRWGAPAAAAAPAVATPGEQAGVEGASEASLRAELAEVKARARAEEARLGEMVRTLEGQKEALESELQVRAPAAPTCLL